MCIAVDGQCSLSHSHPLALGPKLRVRQWCKHDVMLNHRTTKTKPQKKENSEKVCANEQEREVSRISERKLC